MKRFLLPLAIALPISAVITVVLFLVSAFAGGVCHCETAISVFFPYGTFITLRTSWENTSLYATMLQFPLYAIIIAVVDGRRRRLLASALILIVHSIAAVGALTMYR